MESPHPSRPSRRSYPNLQNFSFAPLSSNYPVDASQPASPATDPSALPHSSYIQLKSAPPTPGILSQSSGVGKTRNGRRRSRGNTYVHDGYFLNPDAPLRDIGDLPKAKSTNALLPGGSFMDRDGLGKLEKVYTGPFPVRPTYKRHHTSETNDEWLHRAGLAIAGETHKSKGQSWLIRRESTTSLVPQADGFEEHPPHDPRRMSLLSGEHLDDDFSPLTPRWSKGASLAGSRAPSARNSRRGSRVGSHTEFHMPVWGMSSLDEDPQMEGDLIEPDFVEGDEESDGDEEEVARLASQRGFGLGGWVDRLMGWTLFSVEEDGEESEDDESMMESLSRTDSMSKEELDLQREVEAKRKKMEREAIVEALAANANQPEDSKEGEEAQSRDDGSGWQDAAWLLSVASKVLL